MSLSSLYTCKQCMKIYKTELNYNKHLETHKQIKTFKCSYCDNEFKFNQSRWRHEKTCKEKLIKNKEDDLKNEFMSQINELKKQIADLMNEKYKMHPKTFQKMKNNIEVNNGTISENINNGTINNINIIALGNENLEKVFSEAEQISILNKKNNALNYMIEYVHFNDKYPQFQNIVITNNRTNMAHLFDKDTKTFRIVNKDELIETLIDYRVCDIEDFFIAHKDKLDENTKIIIQKLTEERGDDEQTMNDVKLLIFNNRSKVRHLLNK